MYYITFFRWLKFQQKRNDIIGDLALDIFRDKKTQELPSKSLNALRLHLEYSGATPMAFRALDEAWMEYKQYRIKHCHD